jgi:cytochrome oxidase Cu insertion factor (SCO1/SenC/PrrC family)
LKDLEIKEMNRLSILVMPPWTDHSRLFQPIVLAVILSVSLVAEAQSPSAARRLKTSPQPKTVAAKPETNFTCVMHPKVRSAKRGKCPKCGMALRLTRVDASSPANSNPAPNTEMVQSVAIEESPIGAADSSAMRRMVIPDVEVLDQDGKPIHFYSDLIKGKTVAINFIFTTCTTICPPLGATFARVQKDMGDKVGRDVHFISISVDPLTDTPERLKAWGDKFKAGPGWTFVTGNKQEIGQLLNALGTSVARREDHSPTVIVGNDLKGVWARTYGLAKTSQMIGLILDVMDGKTDQALTEELGKP